MHGVQPVVYPTRTHDRGDRDICGIARDGAKSLTAVPAHSPQPDKFDWIQLTSDEWLKGEFIALYDDAVEFDSEELEELRLDWEDVRVLRTARAVQVRFKDQTQVTGRVVIDASTVRVLGDTEQQFPRAELVSIAPGEPRELSYWSGNITFGFNLRTGNNSDQVEANTVASARRRTVTTRVVLDYVANYNLTDEIAVTNNQRANGAMDWFVTARFFVRPIVAEYFRDPFRTLHTGGPLAWPWAIRWWTRRESVGNSTQARRISTRRSRAWRQASPPRRVRLRCGPARRIRTNSPKTSITRRTTAFSWSNPRPDAIRTTSSPAFRSILWGRSTSIFHSSGIACRSRVRSRLVSSRKRTTTG